ncbi:oligosaccharide flippase family protein [Novosphingobium mangrovi (ex Huang et al. 2023)]|uniref:Oligosaccharide flippase family protein n=1 Tax=Novosphingobium mangrovi (ex Huang et al. 2023) TaxID=2976432 RepID=A0ABT2I2S1_9SPHN|nr:oligosaccharide flippase family protein [Novosphingobium mangrovi (ex Huang et al. 2023)]MCT2398907.1 oligosaccharide flippase family protein [Novosphingobium mangrovi (ex Huang et al. 2023)]
MTIPGAVPRKRAFRSAGRQGSKALFAFSARGLQQVSTLVITLLAARFLLPSEYGIYSLGIVFIVLVQTMTYTGFYQFILTAREDDGAVLSTCFWLIVGLVSLASLLLALAAFPLEWMFQARPLGTVLVLLALIQPLASIGAWSSATLLRRGEVMRNFAVMFVQNLVALLGGAVLLVTWHSIYALVAFRYLRVLTGAILYALLGRDRPRLIFRRDLAGRAMAFSGSLYGSRLLNFLARYAADLLLGAFHSPTAVGLYRFGSRVATGATDVFTQPMCTFAATQFGAAARQDKDLATPLARFAGTITLLSGIAGAVIIVFARDVIAIFFQPSYFAALVVTYAMALRGAASVGQTLVEPVFAALGRTGRVMMFDMVSTAISIAAIFAASPFGLEVLAWIQALVVLGTTAWAFHLLRWQGRIRIGGAVRNLAGAAALSAGYGLVLFAGRAMLSWVPVDRIEALGLGLVTAALLALAVLALAARLRVFSLGAFSG